LRKLKELIREAETIWFDLLYRHCAELFSSTFLPSHDHLHHARVWDHARELLLLLDENGITIPVYYPEQLLIAAFFHDTGLVRSSGELHGKDGRLLCENFLSDPAVGPPKPGKTSLESILYAIEHHDDKNLISTNRKLRPGEVPGLLTLLSASDDLDAFGNIGIYRYAEIYLVRGIAPEDLPRRIARNVKNRFDNLKNTFGYFEDFILVQEKRYRQVYDFCLRLLDAFASRAEKPSWEPELIGIIGDSISNQHNLLNTGRILPKTEFNKEINAWFRKLDNEIRN
jgi:HD superfamily phosphodiesterase